MNETEEGKSAVTGFLPYSVFTIDLSYERNIILTGGLINRTAASEPYPRANFISLGVWKMSSSDKFL